MIKEHLMVDYAEISTGTALYPEEQALSYLTAGLTGELSELFEVCFYYSEQRYDSGLKEVRVSEAGDVLWYLSQIAVKVLDKPFHVVAGQLLGRTYPPKTFKEFQKHAVAYTLIDSIQSTPIQGGQQLTINMLYSVSRMNEMVKKAIRDNDGQLLDKHDKAYTRAYSTIAVALAKLMHWYYLELNTVAHKNIIKLQDREKQGTIKDLNRPGSQ